MPIVTVNRNAQNQAFTFFLIRCLLPYFSSNAVTAPLKVLLIFILERSSYAINSGCSAMLKKSFRQIHQFSSERSKIINNHPTVDA